MAQPVYKDPREASGTFKGGVGLDLVNAGFNDATEVDDKTLVFTGPNAQPGWQVKENENLGFDVYDHEGNRVLSDINANKDNVATLILQYQQNRK